MGDVAVFAPAKVNLTLHVTGRRDDGYHLLDTLVAFAGVGDTLTAGPADAVSIAVAGPEADGVPANRDNLALRAAEIVLEGRGAALSLDKRLPPASGIGGGSSDAAAAVRAVRALCDPAALDRRAPPCAPIRQTHLSRLAALGADLPMCLCPRPLRARGIGERLAFVELPPLPAVLVNPRVAVATPAVFAALTRRDNPPMPDSLPAFADPAAAIDWLAEQRNDMESAATGLAPRIATALAALAAQPGCGLARMSGSGATCFGLFRDATSASDAAASLAAAHPGWWVAGGALGDQTEAARPRPV